MSLKVTWTIDVVGSHKLPEVKFPLQFNSKDNRDAAWKMLQEMSALRGDNSHAGKSGWVTGCTMVKK